MNITLNLCIVLTNIIFILFCVFYLFKTNSFKMNAEPLTHQNLFKAALIIPIISFILLGCVVWSGHNLQIDAEGFNNFLTISKLPLAALSLSIPFGVIVNNIHRTIQTDKQIKESEKKNLVDGFYSHRKNTVEAIQNIELPHVYILDTKHKLQFRNYYACYKAFYPFASSSNSNFETSKTFISASDKLWTELDELIKESEWKGTENYFLHANKIELCIMKIHAFYMLKEFGNEVIFRRSVSEKNSTYEFTTVFSTERDLKMTIKGYLKARIALMEFLEYEITEDFDIKTVHIQNYISGAASHFLYWGASATTSGNTPHFVKIR